MNLLRPTPNASRLRLESAFTMVEIALALAVIGFAIVAIIGVLPMGLDVQKNNRRETIINQDANYLLESLRGSAQGLDDLTNYVIAITNYWTRFDENGSKLGEDYDGYDIYGSRVPGIADNSYPLTNGLNIIGVLGTPKFRPFAGGFYSNYVVAYFRALSGAAAEKYPQANDSVREMAFSYRLVSEVLPLRGGGGLNYENIGFFHPSWTNFTDFSLIGANSAASVISAVTNWAASLRAQTNADTDVAFYLAGNNIAPAINTNLMDLPAFREAANRWLVQRQIEANLYDVRLLFRWPVNPGIDPNTQQTQIGNGRQVYRTLFDASLTNDPPGGPLWFMRPQTYLQAK